MTGVIPPERRALGLPTGDATPSIIDKINRAACDHKQTRGPFFRTSFEMLLWGVMCPACGLECGCVSRKEGRRCDCF